jgi:hypothetical protein
MGREEEWGDQLGVASLGWLQSPFFIVCLNQGNSFVSDYGSYYSEHVNDDIAEHFLTWHEMISVISKLQPGKATSTFVKPEHILNSCISLTAHLHILFNGMIQHGYVPSDFLKSVITPIIKDNGGDASSTDNYRGISIGVIFAQLFEYAMFEKFSSFLYSDDLQFGFKVKHSTSHALFTLKTCVEYFCKHGSNVFVTFMDCSKAFDKISHDGLFVKLMKRLVPLCFLQLLVYWYSNLTAQCRWGDKCSFGFDVTTGVKQGGVLSPYLFAVYIDDLIVILRSRQLGCHMVGLFLACLFYADDLTLVAPLRSVMQQLIDICYDYGREYCLSFNFKKTKTVVFGKNPLKVTPANLTLNGEKIEFVSEWKYLGATVCNNSTSYANFMFSAQEDLRKFYGATNVILSATRKPDKNVLLHLLYTNCVPILSYAAEVKEYSSRDMTSLNTAVNFAIRRVFTYNRWESVRTLRESLGYQSIYELFAIRKENFLSRIPFCHNKVLSQLLQLVRAT